MLRQEPPTTVDSKNDLNDQKSKKSFKAFWWIVALLAVNVALLSVNIHLALETSSKVAMFQEKPLDSLPRPDPLYEVLRNSSSL
jgi:hypothetical protein